MKWKNFLSTGNSFTEIQLNKHPSTLIVGENGAGKSTLLDAICYGLYGKPFRRVKKDQLINSINGRDVVVEIEFSTHNHSYLVRRGIKPNLFEIHKDGKLLDQDAAARDYQEMLEQHILKLSMKSFTQIVILGSSSFVPFMQLTTNVRREVIEDLLDIRVFSSMALLLKDRVVSNREEYRINEQAINLNNESLHAQEKLRAEIDEQRDVKIEQYRARIILAQQSIEKTQEKIDDICPEVDELIEQCGDRDSVVARIHKILSLEQNLESKKNNAVKTIKFYTENNECPTCAQLIEETLRKSKIDEKENTIESIKEALTKLGHEHSQSENRHSEIQRIQINIAGLQTKIRSLQSIIESNQNEINIWNKEITDLNEAQGIFTEAASVLARISLDKALTDKEQILRDKEMYELATVILRDSGIKSRIIKQYIAIINKLVNKYLAAMDFFVKFELNESFEEKLLSRHRDDFTYESFSEGEKQKIDIALLFTWRAIARMKNSASTNLLIFDEIFDSSLDNAGTEMVMNLLNGLPEGQSAFIISHRGDLLNDKFPNVIKFIKKNNYSVISD